MNIAMTLAPLWHDALPCCPPSGATPRAMN